jgi:hypothetical protein
VVDGAVAIAEFAWGAAWPAPASISPAASIAVLSPIKRIVSRHPVDAIAAAAAPRHNPCCWGGFRPYRPGLYAAVGAIIKARRTLLLCT